MYKCGYIDGVVVVYLARASTIVILRMIWNGQTMVRWYIYKLYMLRYRFALYHTTQSRHIHESVTLTHLNVLKQKKKKKAKEKKATTHQTKPKIGKRHTATRS